MGSSISTTERRQTDCHTPEEILAVRNSLLEFVPTELADLILDKAEYWSKATWGFKPNFPMALDSKSNQGNNATACCLLTPKLCDFLYSGVDGVIRMKAVCFKIVSYDWHHDQRSDEGWHYQAWRDNFSGAYDGSYTWFEAVIVRDLTYEHAARGPSSAKLEIEWIRQALNFRSGDNKYSHCEVVTVKTPDDKNLDTWDIQRNERGKGAEKFRLHTVVWTEEVEEEVDESILMDKTGRGSGREFVRSLMKDDRIAVMARAQRLSFNHIESVELELYYSV